jgi:hypothetical protein
MGRIAEWQLMGAKFVMLGDFCGQFKPIEDPWDGAIMQSADIYRQLARSLHIHLTTNRRSGSDQQLWTFLNSLYHSVDEPSQLAEDVYCATRVWPWDGKLTENTRVFAVSHRLRTKVNLLMNERFVMNKPGAVLVRASGEVIPNSLNQAQDMWIVRGQILQGYSQTNHLILNGVLYEVKEVTSLAIVVRMTQRYRKPPEQCSEVDHSLQGLIVLSYRDASASLRLLHCVVYRSAQGATIPDVPVLLLDTSHRYFDQRTLIVGLSRVQSGSQLRVASFDQQTDAFGFCGRPGRPEFHPSADAAPLDDLLPQMCYEPPEADSSSEESEAAESEAEADEWPAPPSDESEDED